MLSLKEYFEVIDYRISGGSSYNWSCFGPNAHCIDSNSMELDNTEDYGFSLIFDTKTQQVYSVEVHDYKKENSYRMIDPEYKDAYNKECVCILGGLENDVAYDGVKFTNLDVDEDFVKKAKAIINGGSYDDRVTMTMDLTDEEIFRLMQIAHERDITLNQLVEQILTEQINREMTK